MDGVNIFKGSKLEEISNLKRESRLQIPLEKKILQQRKSDFSCDSKINNVIYIASYILAQGRCISARGPSGHVIIFISITRTYKKYQ